MASSRVWLERNVGTSEGTASGSSWNAKSGLGSSSFGFSATHWQRVCAAPCDELVEPGEYRVVGRDVPASSAFDLEGERTRATVHVSEGSTPALITGRVLVYLGAMIAFVGFGMAAGDLGESTTRKSLIFGATGVGLLAVGIPLWRYGTTDVEIE